MLDYGQLYKSKLFRKLLPRFDEDQAVAAKELWERILGRCGVDIGMPAIDTIIDLGCGEGTLTWELAACARLAAIKKRPIQKTQIQFVGVECSASAIMLAKRKCRNYKNIKFVQWNKDFLSLFAALEAGTLKDVPHKVNWHRTALACLGHTWFHLNQQDICAAISKYRPALLLLEVHHTWDATIRKLRDTRGALEFEHGRPDDDDGCIYWLATKCQEGATMKVQRGIWKMPMQPTSPKHKLGDWLFAPTEQHATTSADLFGKSPESPISNVLEQSRLQGAITGERGCDYVTRRVIRHASGWAEMQCHVLVPRDRTAAVLNRAYFAAVRNIVTRLFVASESAAEFGVLRSLLALFDEPSITWRKDTGFAGSREAMIILPFDPHTNFARIIGLFPNTKYSTISDHDLILEAPTTDQLRFPTAYGLFHTLEGRTSSPQAFPLEWAPNYEHALVDTEFANLEEKLLGISDAKGKEIGEGKERGYFLIPIYFGSLPLFTLALRFPSLFPTESTDYQVYYSALRNLHSEVKVALTDWFIQNKVLSPWIASALDALMELKRLSVPGTDDDDVRKDVLERLLHRLEIQLFGQAKGSAEAASSFSVAGLRRSGGVLGKDWKSWVLSIPSVPIKRLRSVEAENTRLWELWCAEKKRALLDHELRISYWFQEGDFFCDDRHDKWQDGESEGTHRRCLTAMLRRLDDGDVGDIIDAMAGDGYFARSKEHYLLNWLLSKMRLILSQPSSGVSDDQKNEAFKEMKAAFCKTLENTGTGMRFSWLRLGVHIAAAATHAVVPQNEGKDGLNDIKVYLPKTVNESSSWHKDRKGPDARFVAQNDQTVLIGELVHALNQLRCVKAIRLSLSEWLEGDGCGKLIVNLKTKLNKDIGGRNCERIRKYARQLLGSDETHETKSRAVDQWLYGRRKLVVVISLTVKKTALAINFELQ